VFLGYFSCQGAPSPPIEAFIHDQIIQDEEEWNGYLTEVRKHPNEEDLQNVKRFAHSVIDEAEVP
jgi:hypothetical protein